MVAKLERVALRLAFPSEVKDLSKWVQNNIEELNAATGLSLSNPEREQPAGDFSVDLVAEDDSGNKVIIENQLGKSDHDHLGKVLTYLTAHEAQTAIWIVEKPRVEHVNAFAWLNQSSSAEFYLVKIEAFRIGTSDPAALLTLIVGPSEETKIIAGQKDEFNLRHTERLKFWKGLLEVANKKTQLHAGRAPTKDNWLAGASGTAGISFTYAVRQHDARIEVVIARGPGRATENKEIFKKLLEKKDQIEQAYGEKLDWLLLEEKDACLIQATTNLGGYRDPDKWPAIFEWLTDKMVALEQAFRPHIKDLHL
jgi:Domain of unknown function (DUF4268)